MGKILSKRTIKKIESKIADLEEDINYDYVLQSDYERIQAEIKFYKDLITGLKQEEGK